MKEADDLADRLLRCFSWLLLALLLAALCFAVPSGGLTEAAYRQDAPWTPAPYGIALAGSAAVAAALAGFLLAGMPGVRKPHTAFLMVLIVLGALIFARLVWCLVRLEEISAQLGPDFILRLNAGGYSVAGAVLGGTAGALLYVRMRKPSGGLKALSDRLLPSCLLVLGVCRMAEYFTHEQGLGDYLMDERFCFFPLGIDCGWDWRIPVFFWEGLLALGLFVFSLVRILRGKPLSSVKALTLISAGQILLESLREDDSLRFGFVRFNQLCCAGALLLCLWLSMKKRRPVPFLLMLLGLALCTGVEFALDKTGISNLLLYGVMTLALAGCCILIWSEAKKADAAEASGISEKIT